MPSFNNNLNATDVVRVNCNDQFALINGTCRPLCGKLQLYSSKTLSDSVFVIEVLTSIVAEFFGFLIIISSYIWRKKM